MPKIDYHAILSALFLPLLLWTGSVVAISLMGYPGVVCMTPVAWLLALPVGLRVHRELGSPGSRPVLEAALGGGLLGFWQGILVPAVMIAAQSIPGQTLSNLPDPIFAALLVAILSIPITGGLAALITFWMRKRAQQ